MASTYKKLRLSAIVLSIMVGTVAVAGLAMRHSAHQALLEDSRLSEQRLNLYGNNLTTLIERYRALPAVLALDPDLIDALGAPIASERQLALNLKLEKINGAAQSSTLELLDRDGLAVAASNWRTEYSYVGHNYAFRPYFQQTLTQGSGRFYAVGVTSGIPGYFLSSAVVDEHGRFLGAIVVKLEFPQLERQWRQDRDILLVSDARGVIFLASDPRWRYRLLRPLDGGARAALASTRQYDRQPLAPLGLQPLQKLAANSQLARIDAAEYLWESMPLPAEGWTLHLLRPWQDDPARQRNAALGAASAWLCLVFGVLYGYQRLRLARVRRQHQRELEYLVDARTRELRTAQQGLVHAARLAALGQMAATLAHELNQPLTTQRMQLASLRLLLDQGRFDEARAALGPFEHMVQRMNALTQHLKTFARKSPQGVREHLDLAHVVEQAVQLLAGRLKQEHVTCTLALARPAPVSGDPIRLEQVLINLLRNALDAMAASTVRQLRVTLVGDAGYWRLQVCDSGGGIAEQHLARLFDPFFTTKPAGEGLGLGLAISAQIAQEHGGRLEADNQGAGACFTLTLPIAEEAP
ncbi:sensor histidine kinase [Pseudomonas typographi]|uniref:histidine kinase n=1 Tax=Pseudomonas typographi TaxID=2715964 RepID=A0ABR7YWG9_9PSED|nr:ATP-binding protein [Pseudomonas typographi]MBD1585597.1 sensor histidine kinase [Pseudomonas typographi]MBD1597489.1 sensor histidine kinase [Pseudomonas typographi]